MRAVRFAAVLDFTLDPDTQAAIDRGVLLAGGQRRHRDRHPGRAGGHAGRGEPRRVRLLRQQGLDVLRRHVPLDDVMSVFDIVAKGEAIKVTIEP